MQVPIQILQTQELNNIKKPYRNSFENKMVADPKFPRD